MIKSTFKLEKKLVKKGYDFVIGIDEAGRGPLAGPVVACACVLFSQSFALEDSKAKLWNLIRDSKTLSHRQRESLFDFIHEHFHVGVGICDHKTIDRMNILEASFLAMKKAVAELKSKMQVKSQNYFNLKTIILVDGNKPIPNLSMEQKAVPNGDRYIKSISAASIIAKVTRDRIMLVIHKKYPQYGFDRHKGYGTKLHFRKLKKHGPCKIHRKTFHPVAKRKNK